MDIKTQYYVSKKRVVQGRARINTQSVALKEEYTKKQNEEKRLESKENMHQKEMKMVLKKVEFNEEYCNNVMLPRGSKKFIKVKEEHTKRKKKLNQSKHVFVLVCGGKGPYAKEV